MDSLNILCFGDSLTEGYSAWGSQFTPYADDMKAWLDTELSPLEVTVEVDGRSGDCVDERLGNFHYRIAARCTKAATQSAPFDWIVILGGTNDLGSGLAAASIFASLKKIYTVALQHGAQILALTVPECAAKVASLDANRNALNNLIKEYRPEGFDGCFHTLDLFALMPYHSEIKDTREEIWDDGLHFTPYGYNVMGDYVAQHLVGLLPMVEKVGDTQKTQSVATNGTVSH